MTSAELHGGRPDARPLPRLVCPAEHAPLRAERDTLVCPECAARYAVQNGIPRFSGKLSREAEQVRDAFAYKWTRGDWGYATSHRELMRRFFFERFGFTTDEDCRRFFDGKLVLHAGCGNAQDEQHYLHHARAVWGVDLSRSVDAARRNWREHHPELAERLHLAEADLMAMPFADESFDVILADGVLHHTPDTRAALVAIARKARPGGHVMFYVYRKKAPIREFVDDYLREALTPLAPDDAWRALQPLTALARDLSRQGARIRVPEDFELLGLRAGDFDLQRWLYWNVLKFYWNETLDFDENNHVNFDWYYPRYAWRHTPEEVRGWLRELGLQEEWFGVGDSGLSVIARR